jgi:streptogramin lyase
MKPSVIAVLLILGLYLSACEKDKAPNQPITPTTAPTAWVVNSLASTLSRVDLTTDSVTVNVLSLGQFANDIVISGSTGYVVNSGSNQVQIINLETGQSLGAIEIYRGQNPYSITLDGNQKAYVTNELTGNVSRLDLTSNLEDTAVSAGVSPEGICIYQNKLYITDTNNSGPPNYSYGQGRVWVYSLPNLSFADTIHVALNPQTIKPGPDGMIHVVCTGDYNAITGQVQIINPATMTVVDSIALGGTPGSLVFTTQHKAYLGAGGWATEGYVLSYDGLTHQILHGDPSNPITVPKGAYGVCTNSSGHVLVCCYAEDSVVELDSSGVILKTYNVGDGPVAIAVSE